MVGAVFITFSGNCKKALSLYQICFGGLLQFDFFETELQGFQEKPVVCGSLVSESIIIYGSDLVYEEGRKLGNNIAIFLWCKNSYDRKGYIQKLSCTEKNFSIKNSQDQKLIEVTDFFGVKWVLGI